MTSVALAKPISVKGVLTLILTPGAQVVGDQAIIKLTGLRPGPPHSNVDHDFRQLPPLTDFMKFLNKFPQRRVVGSPLEATTAKMIRGLAPKLQSLITLNLGKQFNCLIHPNELIIVELPLTSRAILRPGDLPDVSSTRDPSYLQQVSNGSRDRPSDMPRILVGLETLKFSQKRRPNLTDAPPH